MAPGRIAGFPYRWPIAFGWRLLTRFQAPLVMESRKSFNMRRLGRRGSSVGVIRPAYKLAEASSLTLSTDVLY